MPGGHQYWFKSEKIVAGSAYPLKRSDLDAALQAADVLQAVYSVRYMRGRESPETVIELIFTPDGAGTHPFAAGRSLLTVWSVPDAVRRAVEAAMLGQGLPFLCEWLAHTGSAGDAWRGAEHRFALRWQGGVLVRETH